MKSLALDRYKRQALQFDAAEAEMIYNRFGGSFHAEGRLARFVTPLSASEKLALRYPEKVDLFIGNRSGSLGAEARRWMEVNAYNENANLSYIVYIMKFGRSGIFGKPIYISEYAISKFKAFEERVDSMNFILEKEDGPLLRFGYEVNRGPLLNSFRPTIYEPKIVDMDELDKAVVG